MKKSALLYAFCFVLAFEPLMADSEDHLDNMDWEIQLSEAQKNNDYGMCHEVVVAAYLDRNQGVLNKAADICWPIGKNTQKLRSGWALMGIETKEDYINYVEKLFGEQRSGAE